MKSEHRELFGYVEDKLTVARLKIDLSSMNRNYIGSELVPIRMDILEKLLKIAKENIKNA